MRKLNGRRSRWVQTEAAKHTTAGSMRQRIAYEEEQVRALMSTSFGGDIEQALEAHHELIRVLSVRLAEFR